MTPEYMKAEIIELREEVQTLRADLAAVTRERDELCGKYETLASAFGGFNAVTKERDEAITQRDDLQGAITEYKACCARPRTSATKRWSIAANISARSVAKYRSDARRRMTSPAR